MNLLGLIIIAAVFFGFIGWILYKTVLWVGAPIIKDAEEKGKGEMGEEDDI
jgi:hypothetical protein